MFLNHQHSNTSPFTLQQAAFFSTYLFPAQLLL